MDFKGMRSGTARRMTERRFSTAGSGELNFFNFIKGPTDRFPGIIFKPATH